MAPCVVDHCSVMHRRSILPAVYRRFGSFWDEDPRFYRIGDARFFWRLNQLWPFHPLPEVMDYNYITPRPCTSRCSATSKSALIRKLPPQKTCKEFGTVWRTCIGHGGRERHMGHYLLHYWNLFHDFAESFRGVVYRQMPLALLANFYKYLPMS